MGTSRAFSQRSSFALRDCNLEVMDGDEQRHVPVGKLPFRIGRRPENDLVLTDPRVSREHAAILEDGSDYLLVDLGSKHGTFVNGQRVMRHRLRPDDCLEFGARDGVRVLFAPSGPPTSGELLSKIGDLTKASDFDKLSLLLEAVRKLNGTRVLEDVLRTLLELTLRLTHAERAYIFLRENTGQLRLAAARDSEGKPLTDDRTISRSILSEAADSGYEFLLTDTSRYDNLEAHNSIIAFDLRTVICLPLLARGVTERVTADAQPVSPRDVRGVLYLDSHFASRELTGISDDVLRALAREAASLLENAYLVQAEQAARYYQQELTIAASIQRNLMSATIPQVPYAAIQTRTTPCREIGGDFFDVVRAGDGLALVVADVCGKGISAALLASTLQGLIYSQIAARKPLVEIAAAVNLFFCQKRLDAKYATIVLALLTPDGELEMVNCGHVPPLLATPRQATAGQTARYLTDSNLPVGLFADTTYESVRLHLQPGERLLLYTDGITEAANAEEEFFGECRLKEAVAADTPLDAILAEVTAFCAGRALEDDCTILEVRFTGAPA